jgi:hypothetical protein
MTHKIIINVVDHVEQRYETVGDWVFNDYKNDMILSPGQDPNAPRLVIRVSNLGNDLEGTKMNCLVAVHELIEALLCKFNEPEITGKEVDEFDFHFEEARGENDNSEPGDSPEAPYHEQHKTATVIEMALASALKVSWEQYEKRINEL